MARSKHRSHKHKHSTAMVLHRRASSAKPIVIKQTKVIKHKAKRRHSGGGGGGLGLGKLFSDKRVQVVLAGLGVGFLEKQTFYASLPSLPFVGKKGTIAIAAQLVGGKLGDDVPTAALLLGAFECATTGKVSGEYVAGEVDGVGYVAGF